MKFLFCMLSDFLGRILHERKHNVHWCNWSHICKKTMTVGLVTTEGTCCFIEESVASSSVISWHLSINSSLRVQIIWFLHSTHYVELYATKMTSPNVTIVIFQWSRLPGWEGRVGVDKQCEQVKIKFTRCFTPLLARMISSPARLFSRLL